MKIRIAALALTFTAVSHVPAYSGVYFTGNKLLNVCTSTVLTEFGECAGYLEGIEDSIEFTRAMNKKQQCLGDTVVVKQIKDVVVKYLQDHPVDRDQPAAVLATLAIGTAWSCN